MLDSAENLAPFLKLSREVVFDLLYDLLIGEAERAPFGLVAIEEGGEPAPEQPSPGSMRFGEILPLRGGWPTPGARRQGCRSGRCH